MDWGDACISHPFFTLSVTLEGVLAWGLDDEEDSEDTAPYRDAYLEPFAERYDGDLVAAATRRDPARLGLPRGQRARARATTSRRSPGCGCSWTAGLGPRSAGRAIAPTVSRWKRESGKTFAG